MFSDCLFLRKWSVAKFASFTVLLLAGWVMSASVQKQILYFCNYKAHLKAKDFPRNWTYTLLSSASYVWIRLCFIRKAANHYMFVCLFIYLIVSFEFETCKKQIRILSDLLHLIVRCALCKKKVCSNFLILRLIPWCTLLSQKYSNCCEMTDLKFSKPEDRRVVNSFKGYFFLRAWKMSLQQNTILFNFRVLFIKLF